MIDDNNIYSISEKALKNNRYLFLKGVTSELRRMALQCGVTLWCIQGHKELFMGSYGTLHNSIVIYINRNEEGSYINFHNEMGIKNREIKFYNYNIYELLSRIDVLIKDHFRKQEVKNGNV